MKNLTYKKKPLPSKYVKCAFCKKDILKDNAVENIDPRDFNYYCNEFCLDNY